MWLYLIGVISGAVVTAVINLIRTYKNNAYGTIELVGFNEEEQIMDVDLSFPNGKVIEKKQYVVLKVIKRKNASK